MKYFSFLFLLISLTLLTGCSSDSNKKMSLSDQAKIKLKGSIMVESGIKKLDEFHEEYAEKCGGYFSTNEYTMKDKSCLFSTDMNSFGTIMSDGKKIQLNLIYNRQVAAYHRLLKFEGNNIELELEIKEEHKLQGNWIEYKGSIKINGGKYKDVIQVVGVAKC